MKLTDKVYDRLKKTALVVLPALGALYFALGQIWHLPRVEEIVGTITAVDTFLGLVIANAAKKNGPEAVGNLVVVQGKEGEAIGMRMEATVDPLVLNEGRNAMFKVKREPEA